MIMDRRASRGWTRFLINILLPILIISISFCALEMWARCKYWKGSLWQKGFASRGKEYTPKKQTPIRIVCVGSSPTHGGGDLADNETYPFYLEDLINKELKANVIQVINSGLAARTTEYQRDFIKERIGDQELDIIIWDSLNTHFYSFFPADLTVKNVITEKGLVKNVYLWHKMSLGDIVHVFLSEHSYFYVRMREKFLKMTGKDINKYYAERKGYVKRVDEVRHYKAESGQERDDVLTLFLNRYYTAVEDVILTAKAHNVDLVLLIPPYPFFTEELTENINDSRPKQYYNVACEKAKQCLVRLGKQYNLLVLDADEGFMKRGRSVDMFLDCTHLSKKGNYIMADIISTELAPYLKKTKIEPLAALTYFPDA